MTRVEMEERLDSIERRIRHLSFRFPDRDDLINVLAAEFDPIVDAAHDPEDSRYVSARVDEILVKAGFPAGGYN